MARPVQGRDNDRALASFDPSAPPKRSRHQRSAGRNPAGSARIPPGRIRPNSFGSPRGDFIGRPASSRTAPTTRAEWKASDGTERECGLGFLNFISRLIPMEASQLFIAMDADWRPQFRSTTALV